MQAVMWCRSKNMRKIIIYSTFSISLLISCVSEKGNSFNNIPQYESNEKYKNLYIVDTIQIDTPIRFFTKNGYEFIMSKKNFDSFNGSEKDLFKSNKTFLVGDLPLGLPISFYEKCYDANDCSSEKLVTNKKSIATVYYYKENPNFFILLLVNGDYFNSAFIGIDGAHPIKDKKIKFNYYKLVIPICTQ